MTDTPASPTVSPPEAGATPRQKQRYYFAHMGDLKQRLKRHVSTEELRELHRIQPWRHFLLAGRHFLVFGLCAWALAVFSNPWIWVPIAVVQGFNILGFIILLHEHVHGLIFKKKRPRIMRFLGLLYAIPSGISPNQFDRWHNDHHRELGSDVDDPKRAHLSPKKNRRWVKLLYFTPALFPIYMRAARKEAATYPEDLQRRIRLDRWIGWTCHLLAIVGLASLGWDVLLRVYVVPVFFCFPPAFMLNRLGQHYDIDPEDPASWSTLVNGNPIWRFLFLFSNHHIEHHYYTGVPFYNLVELNRKLQPFFEEAGIENHSYRRLLYGWLVLNKAPHTHWDFVA